MKWILPLAFATSACSLLFPARAEGEGEGEGDDVGEGEGEGEGEGDVDVVISGVDGDGSARAVVADVDGDRAAHRVAAGFVVDGAGFVDVSAVNVVDADGLVTPLSFNVESPVRLRASALSLPHAGFFSLVVVAAAGSASAQVFVLQGEPGVPAFTELDDATAAECPFGGKAIVTGVGGEVAGRVVTCDVVVVEDRVIEVADVDELRDVLAQLDAVHIGSATTVELRLPDGTFNVDAQLTVNHTDGRRIVIAGSGETVLNMAVGANGVVSSVDGVRLRDLTIKHLVRGPGFGVAAFDRAVIVLEGGVVVSGFFVGVLGQGGGVVHAEESEVADCTVAIQALYDGDVFGFGAHVDGSNVGFMALFGGTIDARSSFATNTGSPYLSQAGSVLDAAFATVDEFGDAGVIANLGAYARADNLAGDRPEFHVVLSTNGGVVEASDVAISAQVFDALATHNSTIFSLGGTVLYAADTDSTVVTNRIGSCNSNVSSDGQCIQQP